MSKTSNSARAHTPFACVPRASGRCWPAGVAGLDRQDALDDGVDVGGFAGADGLEIGGGEPRQHADRHHEQGSRAEEPAGGGPVSLGLRHLRRRAWVRRFGRVGLEELDDRVALVIGQGRVERPFVAGVPVAAEPRIHQEPRQSGRQRILCAIGLDAELDRIVFALAGRKASPGAWRRAGADRRGSGPSRCGGTAPSPRCRRASSSDRSCGRGCRPICRRRAAARGTSAPTAARSGFAAAPIAAIVCVVELQLLVPFALTRGDQAEGGGGKRLHGAIGEHDLALEVDRRHRVGADLVEREQLVDAHLAVGLERLVAAGAVLVEERAPALGARGVDRRETCRATSAA